MFFFNLLLFAFEQKMQIYSLGQKILTPSQFSCRIETDVTAVFLKRFVIPYPYLPIFISLGKQIHVDTRHIQDISRKKSQTIMHMPQTTQILLYMLRPKSLKKARSHLTDIFGFLLKNLFTEVFCYLCICYCSNNVFVDLLCSIFPTLLYPSRCIHKIGMVPTLDTLNIQISNPRPMRRCIAGSVQDRDIKEVNSLL